jgi:hypothetical protein
MFVRYYVELPMAAAQVEQALLGSPAGWLAALARSSKRRGDGLLAEVGVGPLGARLGRRWAPSGRPSTGVLRHRVAEATVKDFLDRVGTRSPSRRTEEATGTVRPDATRRAGLSGPAGSCTMPP